MLKYIASGAALAVSLAAPSQAAVLFDLAAPTGATALPSGYSYDFDAAAGAGTINFQIQGYKTLDGINCCTDTLLVRLNGQTILNGSYALGGGGTSATYFRLSGSTLSINFGAKTLDFGADVNLLSGQNILVFSYTPNFAQGLNDEGWGINTAVVTGTELAGAVPEPSAWALLILGFGLVGGSMRQRAMRRSVSYG